MSNKLITFIAFGSRLAAQLFIVMVGFTFLEEPDYQIFIVLSFLGSFLSLFDLGLLGTVTKKISFVHFQTSIHYGPLLKSVFITFFAVILLFIAVIVLLLNFSYFKNIPNLSDVILLIYFLVFLSNYTFSLFSNFNFSIGNVNSARKIEIVKHLLTVVSACVFLIAVPNIKYFFLLLTCSNIASIIFTASSFYWHMKKFQTVKSQNDPNLETEKVSLKWGRDFFRSSGSEVLFKTILFYTALNIPALEGFDKSNVALTVLKMMELLSTLTLQLLWSNISFISTLAISKKVHVKFYTIFGLVLICFMMFFFAGVILSLFETSTEMLVILMLSCYFFWIWRSVAFFELLSNTKDIYWQHWPLLFTLVWIAFFKVSLFQIDYLNNVTVDLLLVLPAAHIIYFYFIHRVTRDVE